MVMGVTVGTAEALADVLSTLSPSGTTKTTSLGWIKALHQHQIHTVRQKAEKRVKILPSRSSSEALSFHLKNLSDPAGHLQLQFDTSPASRIII